MAKSALREWKKNGKVIGFEKKVGTGKNQRRFRRAIRKGETYAQAKRAAKQEYKEWLQQVKAEMADRPSEDTLAWQAMLADIMSKMEAAELARQRTLYRTLKENYDRIQSKIEKGAPFSSKAYVECSGATMHGDMTASEALLLTSKPGNLIVDFSDKGDPDYTEDDYEPTLKENLLATSKRATVSLGERQPTQASGKGISYLGFDGEDIDGPEPWEEFEREQQQVSITESIKLYTQYLRAKGDSDETIYKWNDRLGQFKEFVGGHVPAEKVNEHTLLTFANHWRTGKGWGQRTLSDALGMLRQYVGWASRQKHMARPENLQDLTVKRARQQNIQIVDTAQVRQLFDTVTDDQTRLYMLLAANCGFTQQDISDLAPSEVNWNAGTITRQRSKQKEGDVKPLVTWCLWSETLDLLEKHSSKDNERLLVNRNEQPLVIKELTPEAKIKKSDAIRNRFFRVCKTAGVSMQFKQFRSKGVTFLEEKFGEAFSTYWQGNSGATVGRQSYIGNLDQRMPDAMAWLHWKYFEEELEERPSYRSKPK